MFAAGHAGLDALRHLAVEELLLPLLLILGIMIGTARLFACLFRWLGQPSVVGEIVAGLVLGPSVLGRLAPGVWQALFRPEVAGVPPEDLTALLGWILTALSELGLVFLLFLIGLELDFHHLRRYSQAALGTALAGIVTPFVLGLLLAQALRPHLETPVPPLGFALFLGTALAITALPVLGRILLELNLTRTRLGTITIAAAALDDVLGWILLATVASLARLGPAAADWMQPLALLGKTVLFGLLLALGRPYLLRWSRQALRRGDGDLDLDSLALLLVLILACALATNWIGIFAVFGPFLLGTVFSGDVEFRRAAHRRLHDVVIAFFLPVFFTYTGLRTDVGTLDTWQLWLLAGVVTLVALVGKVSGCGVAAWLGGFPVREAACIGALMNTRGLMALVVINLGKDLGIIPASVYCMLVLMAVVTTALTTPLLVRLLPGTELAAVVRYPGYRGSARRAALEPEVVAGGAGPS